MMVEETYTKEEIIRNILVGRVVENLLEFRKNGEVGVFRKFCNAQGETCIGCPLENANCGNSIIDELVDRLIGYEKELSKYKYKLTKFEYDLLKVQPSTVRSINDYEPLCKLVKAGYFKDIPMDASIEDILNNCEVIDEADK